MNEEFRLSSHNKLISRTYLTAISSLFTQGDDIDQILEENNLLVPMEPDEKQDNTE